MRIALIHALALSIPPIVDAFATHWPQAQLNHVLDDALSSDLARDGALTDAMHVRFEMLARYVVGNGADAILFTCSAFAPCIDAVKRQHAIPILRPNEAMFEAALARGTQLGLVASFAPSITTMTPELHAMAAARGATVSLSTACAAGAMSALAAGDGPEHDRLLAESAPKVQHCDVVMLAQFSTARAAAALQARLQCPVLTSPDTAVRKLKGLLT